MTSIPPVVLLGGDVIALSVARSLSAAGARVHALGLGTDPSRNSRYCDVFVDLGSLRDFSERSLAWLQDGPRGAVVLPCDDDGLEFVARNRPTLEDWGYLPVEADDDVVLAMLDKTRTYELAREAGVPAPRTVALRDRADADAAVAEIGYPCALKPTMGHIARVHDVRDRLIIVDDDQQLAAGLERTLDAGVDVLLTELVAGGPGSSCSLYTYLTREGAPLFQVNKRSHRQFPIRFGLTTYHETVDEPEVTELGLRFFRSIGLVGVGNVEFKQDARDGEWRLIECNHRFTAANELIRRAGVDIALIAYLRAAGRPAPPVNSYRTGLWMWHPLEDLRALPAYRRSGDMTLRGWLRSLAHRQHFQLMRWNDPLPSLVSLARKIPQAARRLRRSPWTR